MDTKENIYHPLVSIINECEQIVNSSGDIRTEEKEKLLKNLSEIRTHSLLPPPDKKNLYNLLFEKAPVGIVQYNKNAIITSCNDQFVEIIGSSREKLIGLKLMQLLDKKVIHAIHNSLNGKTSYYEGNYSSVTADKITPVRAVFMPTQTTDEIHGGGIGIVEDQTEARLTEIALQESRARYETLFEKNPSVMLIVDPNSGYLFDANPAAANFYGRPRKSLRKLTIFDLDTGEKSAVKASMENILSAKENFSRTNHQLSDGTIKTVEIVGGSIQFAMRKLVYFIIRDVTRRIEIETDLKKFQLGLDRASNPVFITDIDGNIKYVNAAFTNLYGYTEDEVLGKNPQILKSEEQPDSFYADFWDTILSGEVASGEIVNKTKSGDHVTVLYSSNPIILDDGTITGFLAIHDDITDRINMEGDIRQSLYEKEVLLAEVHHRVKNNLAMVSALMILQAETAENAPLKSKLMDSANRIKAISNIHEHLYSTNNFSSVDIVKNTRELIQNIIDSLQTETEISVKKSGPVILLAVSQAVYCSLIINEVVTNIIKHAFKGCKTGTIAIITEETGENVKLTITDNGNELPYGFSSGRASSLGMELIHILTRQIEGSFEYLSQENTTSFVLTFKKKGPDKVPIEVMGKASF